MTLSRETLELLSELLNQLQVPVGHADFETNIGRVITAKRELGEALASGTVIGTAPPQKKATWPEVPTATEPD